VPFKDGWSLTEACLKRLEDQRSVKVKCVLVDNNSQDPQTRQDLKDWLSKPRQHDYVIHDFKAGFNFAKMNNEAVSLLGAEATHVLFLNNDVEMTDPRTLETMISNLAYDEKMAFCGIRLDYPFAGGVQHGGIKFGLELRGGPLFRTTHMTSATEFMADDHVVTAVTFACAMCRKEVFNILKGLEEDWLPNGFGDVDIGLRAIRAGYRNFYLGSVTGLHHESKTRKDFCEDLEQMILYQRNSDQIQRQMIRQLGYDTFIGLQTGASWFAKPLRYRIADRANNILKVILGPFHRRLRSKWKQLEANLEPTK
jgi:GT2 family glycosyltransferase